MPAFFNLRRPFRFNARYAFLALSAACFLYACSDSPSPETGTAAGSAEKPVDGQQLFVENCAACHQRDRDATGPALAGVTGRWGNDTARLRAFIRNNQAALERGNPRAVELRQEWSAAMPLYTDFTDRDIDAILGYIEGQ